MSRFAFVLSGLLACCVSAASGQQTPSPPRIHAILSTSTAGTLFRVRTGTGLLAEGPVGRLDSTSVLLGAGPMIPLADVTRLWQRGTAWRTGGILGAVALGVSTGFLGALASGLNHDNPFVGGAAGTALGAAVGFGLGAAIGSGFGKWRLRFP